MLARTLKHLGFEVSEAANGEIALASLQQLASPPELALVDWNMPVMDGLALVQQIRANADWASMRVMMVTTETEVSRMADALAAGADEYMMKPFSEDALRDKLLMLGLEV
jgi:two-component system chemotaxis response regulator CheY